MQFIGLWEALEAAFACEHAPLFQPLILQLLLVLLQTIAGVLQLYSRPLLLLLLV